VPITGVQGQSPWSRARAPGQGPEGEAPPEAEALLAFRRSMKAANFKFAHLSKIWKAKKSDICVIFAKIEKNHKWPRNKWGL